MLSILLTCLATSQTSPAVPTPDPMTTIDVSIQTYDGASLAGFPFSVDSGSRRLATEFLDENNTARLEFQGVSAGQVKLFGTVSFEAVGADGMQHITELVVRLRTQYYFPHLHAANPYIPIDIEPGQRYSVELKAEPAMTVTGRMSWAPRGPLSPRETTVAIASLGSLFPVPAIDREGRILIRGLPRDEAVRLYLTGGIYVQSLDIPAHWSAETVDVGLVRIRRPETGVWLHDLHLNLAGAIELSQKTLTARQHIDLGALLVSETGEWVLSVYGSNDFEEPMDITSQYALSSNPSYLVPEGRYYVVPDWMRARSYQIDVIEAAKRGWDLTKYGVPTIDVRVTDEPQPERIIDTVAALKAAREVSRIMRAPAAPDTPVPSDSSHP